MRVLTSVTAFCVGRSGAWLRYDASAMFSSDVIYDQLQAAYEAARRVLEPLFDERLNDVEEIAAARARSIELLDLIDECTCLFNESDYHAPKVMVRAATSIQ